MFMETKRDIDTNTYCKTIYLLWGGGGASNTVCDKPKITSSHCFLKFTVDTKNLRQLKSKVIRKYDI